MLTSRRDLQGLILKFFWKASKATTEPHFNAIMKEIQQLSNAAHEYLLEKDPKTWKKPIITMYVMDKMHRMQLKGSTWPKYEICPVLRQKINNLKMQQRYWQVLPCRLMQFETRNLGEAYAVNLEKKTCTCRLWERNDYGCVHSLATISYVNGTIE